MEKPKILGVKISLEARTKLERMARRERRSMANLVDVIILDYWQRYYKDREVPEKVILEED